MQLINYYALSRAATVERWMKIDNGSTLFSALIGERVTRRIHMCMQIFFGAGIRVYEETALRLAWNRPSVATGAWRTGKMLRERTSCGAFAPDTVRHGSRLARNWRTARQRKLTRPPLFNRRDRTTDRTAVGEQVPTPSLSPFHPRRRSHQLPSPYPRSTSRRASPFTLDLSQVRIDAVEILSNPTPVGRFIYMRINAFLFVLISQMSLLRAIKMRRTIESSLRKYVE